MDNYLSSHTGAQIDDFDSRLDSKLSLTGGIVSGPVVLSRTTIASGTADNLPALIVGGPPTGQHIEIDGRKILAKQNGTTPSTLYLQDSSNGTVRVDGTGGLIVSNGHLTVSGGNIWSGDQDGNSMVERVVGVRAKGGQLYMCSSGSTTGNRGLYAPANGTGSGKFVIQIDTNNNATFNGVAASASKIESGALLVEEKVVINNSSYSIPANTHKNADVDITKTGYTALGIVGHYIQNGKITLVWNYLTSPTTYRWCLGNPTSSAQAVAIFRVYILYQKN